MKSVIFTVHLIDVYYSTSSLRNEVQILKLNHSKILLVKNNIIYFV